MNFMAYVNLNLQTAKVINTTDTQCDVTCPSSDNMSQLFCECNLVLGKKLFSKLSGWLHNHYLKSL
jgi:hypothetical protein